MSVECPSKKFPRESVQADSPCGELCIYSVQNRVGVINPSKITLAAVDQEIY